MADNVARALALIAIKNSNDIKSLIGDIKIEKLTRAEYEQLEIKDSNTIYLVVDDTQIVMYLGDTLIGYGAGDANISKLMIKNSNNNIIGNFQEVNER